MQSRSPRPLRIAALSALAVGAIGSVGLTLRAGQRNPSRVLMALFVVWVLSPFAALAVGHLVSKGWPILTQATLYSLMPIVATVTLAIYGEVALGPPRAKTAFPFLVVPLASWLVGAIALAIAAVIARRNTPRERG